MQTLKAIDAINGATGAIYAIINGKKEHLISAISVDAKMQKIKREIKVIGTTTTKHKGAGWTGTGTMSIYYNTTLFRDLMVEYARTGKDTYFEMLLINEDPSSDIGSQELLLTGVNINEASMGKLDVNSTELTEDVPFTFTGMELLKKFNTLQGE